MNNSQARHRTRKRALLAVAEKRAGPSRVIKGKDRRPIVPKGIVANLRKPWIAPDDMEQWQVDEVKAGRMCGAKLTEHERANAGGRTFCTSKPAAHQKQLGRTLPYRCGRHGGHAPAPRDAIERYATVMRGLKHGIYGKAVLIGEESDWAAILEDPANLDGAIAIMRMRLARAVKAEAEQEEALASGDEGAGLVTRSRVDKIQKGFMGRQESSQIERGRIDWAARVESMTNSLARLVAQKTARDQASGDTSSPEESARLAREALRLAREGLKGGLKA